MTFHQLTRNLVRCPDLHLAPKNRNIINTYSQKGWRDVSLEISARPDRSSQFLRQIQAPIHIPKLYGFSYGVIKKRPNKSVNDCHQ